MREPTKNKSSQELSGFTIVEFTLATAFISALLISISIVASMVIQIYQKGLTLKSINSVGRGVTDELIGAINAAPSVDTTNLCNNYLTSGQEQCRKNNANEFIYQEYINDADSTQLGGLFCTGNYSYIWNTYYGLHGTYSESGAIRLKYAKSVGGDVQEILQEKINLIQVKDPTYRVCSSNISPDKYKSKFEDASGAVDIDITKLANGITNVIDGPTSGYLESSEVKLQLYELTVFPISQDQVTLRTFMSGTFILATERGNVDIRRSGDYCDINNLNGDETTSKLLDIGSEFTYCGINKFNFAARTAGM